MPVSPARSAAFRILGRVDSKQGFAIDLLQAPAVSALKEADRCLATELVMGVLRWRGDLDFEIERLSGKPLSYFDPEVALILRLGVYQVTRLQSIPARAAIYEAVEMVKAARKRSAAGMVNAILRKCVGSRIEESEETSARRSIPNWLRERWRRNFGAAAAEEIIQASQEIPETCVRVTGSMFSRETVQREIEAAGMAASLGPFGERALRIKSGNVLSTQAWREGRVVIQDEASQLVATLVRPVPGQRVLDLCAAPGIKAGQIADDLREGIYIACDRSRRRLRTLQRITRAAWPAEVALNIVLLDAAEALPFSPGFDRILVDAPCSGTGTLARNPEIKWRLQPEDIARLSAMQAQILQTAMGALGPGGRLVYSTCSLEPEENESVAETALAAGSGFRQLPGSELQHEFPALAPFFDKRGFFRTRPGPPRLDGFFAAVFARD